MLVLATSRAALALGAAGEPARVDPMPTEPAV